MSTSVRHTATFTIGRAVDEVFPLFSPEGERLWVPGWDYENVMGTTRLAEDYVFLTEAHDHASDRAVWIVKRYEPSRHLVAFYKVEPADKVGTVTVQCRAVDGGTEVEVTYAYRALSERGRAFAASFSAEAYAAFIREWKALLERYFRDGPREAWP